MCTYMYTCKPNDAGNPMADASSMKPPGHSHCSNENVYRTMKLEKIHSGGNLVKLAGVSHIPKPVNLGEKEPGQ